MLNKLMNGLHKTWTKRVSRSFLIETPERLETPLNPRKQRVDLRSNRDKIAPPFESRLTLPIFKTIEQGNSASFTESRA